MNTHSRTHDRTNTHLYTLTLSTATTAKNRPRLLKIAPATTTPAAAAINIDINNRYSNQMFCGCHQHNSFCQTRSRWIIFLSDLSYWNDIEKTK